MDNILIKDEFKRLIPQLTPEEFKQLEDNCIEDGIRDALIIWNNYIIDGHNRYIIAQKHGLTFRTEEKEFDNETDVKVWMINNQFGRRNLSNYQRSILALELENVFAEKAKENQGIRTDLTSCRNLQNVDTRQELAKVANVSHDTIMKVKKIQAVATPEIKEKLSTGDLSINQVYQDIKKEERQVILDEKKQEYERRIERSNIKQSDRKIDIYNTDKKFRVIMADPPWSYNDKQDTPMLGGAVKHYNTMSIADISELPINKLTETDAVLFLWVTSPILEECFNVINKWGFKYKASFIWDKIGHNMGHYNSVRHEFLLIATKGSCTPDNKKLYDSVQAIDKNNIHSKKPIEFYDIIDNIYIYGDRVELFSRGGNKDSWFYWGNEV